MTREEILSIEGVEENKGSVNYFIYGNKQFWLEENGTVINFTQNCDFSDFELKPISDIETLKQFLSFFEV